MLRVICAIALFLIVSGCSSVPESIECTQDDAEQFVRKFLDASIRGESQVCYKGSCVEVWSIEDISESRVAFLGVLMQECIDQECFFLPPDADYQPEMVWYVFEAHQGSLLYVVASRGEYCSYSLDAVYAPPVSMD